MGVRYDEVGSRCRGPENGQPGLVAWSIHFRKKFAPAQHWGIYNCRDVRGGSTLSFHAEGRAADDWFYGSLARTIAAVAYATSDEVSEAWGVQEVIDYARDRRWTSNRGWESFARGGDWVHVTLNWDGALGKTSAFHQGPPIPDPKPLDLSEDVMPILDPTRPRTSTGREPFFVLDVDGKKLLGFNGARVTGDKPSGFGFRYWEVPSAAPLIGAVIKDTDDDGHPVPPERQPIIVTAWDGGTFRAEIQAPH